MGLWGADILGDRSPIIRSSVWLTNTSSGEVMLTGATSYHLPSNLETDMQATEPEFAAMLPKGEIPKGMAPK